MFVTVNGVTLHYRLEGQGVPIVFINSLGSDSRIWDGVVEHLWQQCCTLRYDKRGHGLSDTPPGPYSIADHSDDLQALLAHLELEHSHLVGISVGGQIALELAARGSSLVKSAVFCDTGMTIGTTQTWNARINAILEHGIESISSGVIARWFTPDFLATKSSEARGYQNMLERCPQVGYIATCEALREADLQHAAKKIRDANLKTLVICGSLDLSTPTELNQALAATLETKLVLIPNAGHLPCIEQPEMMAQTILEFLGVGTN